MTRRHAQDGLRPCGIRGAPLLLGVCIGCRRCPDVPGRVAPLGVAKEQFQDRPRRSAPEPPEVAS